jgi:hypothetical protein
MKKLSTERVRDDPNHPLGFLHQKFEELKAQRLKVEAEYQKAIVEIDAKLASIDLAYKVLREQYDPDYVAEGCVEPGFAELGMTDQIRALLHASPHKSFTPVLLRDLLVGLGVNLKGRSNPLAEIHTVLKRLVESFELEEIPLEKRKAYRWAVPVRRAAKEPLAS